MYSEYTFYGLGTVAADKSSGSKEIAVFPQEHFPFVSGEITTNHITEEFTGLDRDGNEYKHVLQSGMTLKAIWIGEGNRITAPNVKKGEQVKLYQVGNTGRFYWEELARDRHLRRGEAVTYSYSASLKPTQQDQPPLPNNNYSFTVDGINGHITVTTSSANGEKSAYKAQLNGRAGSFTLVDIHKNLFQIDSPNFSLMLRNGAGSYAAVNKDVITLQNKTKSFVRISDDVIDIENKTGSKAIITGDNISVQNKSNSLVSLEGDLITIKNSTGTKITISGSDVTVQGSGTLNLDMPKVVVKKDLEVGNLITTNKINTEKLNDKPLSAYLNG